MKYKSQSQKDFNKIIKEIRIDPQKGLRLFYEKYGDLIQTTALSVCRSPSKADEVVNAVLVKVWKKSVTVKDIQNPEGWIYIITVNTAKDALKEKQFLPLNDYITDRQDGIEEMIAKDSFYFYIKDLSETEKDIVTNKILGGATFVEIAEETGKSASAVTSIYYRALDKIKEKIEKN